MKTSHMLPCLLVVGFWRLAVCFVVVAVAVLVGVGSWLFLSFCLVVAVCIISIHMVAVLL